MSSEKDYSVLPEVTVIQESAKIESEEHKPKKLRVCAYARVSTEKEEQEYSFENQRDYYMDYISKRSDWEFVGIYSDFGLSGKNKKRPQFIKMIDDCHAGKIDRIITKSMAMQMCLAISRGKEFLDYASNQAGCLYLALEDGIFRLKDRLNKVLDGGKAPSNFYLSIKANGLDGGLIKQLDEEFEEHPDIKLIIIDTLQKVRGSAKKDEIAYATDYRELGALKEYSDNKRICIFLIHHLRKMADENDVFNMISGSNGIMGVCDTIFIIYKKKRQDENAVLFMTGRDIRQQDVVVHFDETKYRWEMVGTAKEEERKRKKREYENNPIVKTVKDLLKQYPMGWKGTATDF